MNKMATARRIAQDLTAFAKQASARVPAPTRRSTLEELVARRGRYRFRQASLERLAVRDDTPGSWAMVEVAKGLVAEVEAEIGRRHAVLERTGRYAAGGLPAVLGRDDTFKAELDGESGGGSDDAGEGEEDDQEPEAEGGKEEPVDHAESYALAEQLDDGQRAFFQEIEQEAIHYMANVAAGRGRSYLAFLLGEGDDVGTKQLVEDMTGHLFETAWQRLKKKYDPAKSDADDAWSFEAVRPYLFSQIRNEFSQLRDKANVRKERSAEEYDEQNPEARGDHPNDVFNRSPGGPDLHFDLRQLLSKLSPELAEPLKFILDSMKLKGAGSTNLAEIVGALKEATGMGYQAFLRALSEDPSFQDWWQDVRPNAEPAWKTRGEVPKKRRELYYPEFLGGGEVDPENRGKRLPQPGSGLRGV
jgi:hypothetical protein